MKAVVAAFNQEKALLGAFSVITNLRMTLFEALFFTHGRHRQEEHGPLQVVPALAFSFLPQRAALVGLHCVRVAHEVC